MKKNNQNIGTHKTHAVSKKRMFAFHMLLYQLNVIAGKRS